MKRRTRYTPPLTLEQKQAAWAAKVKTIDIESEKAAVAHDVQMDDASEKAAQIQMPKLGKLCANLPWGSEQEMQGLMISIKNHGQCRPIVYTADDVLIDGKRRWEACRRLGIEPLNITLAPGDDGEQWAWSEHFLRMYRNLSQRVMGLILIYTSQGKLPMRVEEIAAEHPEFSRAKIFQALFIVEQDGPDSFTVEHIKAGTMSLTEAYETVRSRVDAVEQNTAMLKQLREIYPDLAEAITDGGMSRKSAINEVKRRFDVLSEFRGSAESSKDGPE